MQKVKKIGIFSGIIVIMCMCFFTIKVNAEEEYKDNIKIIELLTYDKITLLNKLLEYGLELPPAFEEDRYLVEGIVFDFTRAIVNDNNGFGGVGISYDQSRDLYSNLAKTIHRITNTKNRRLSQLLRAVHTNYILKYGWNNE